MNILQRLKKLRRSAPAKKKSASAGKASAHHAPAPGMLLVELPRRQALAIMDTVQQVGYQMLGAAQTGDKPHAATRRREAKHLETVSDAIAKALERAGLAPWKR